MRDAATPEHRATQLHRGIWKNPPVSPRYTYSRYFEIIRASIRVFASPLIFHFSFNGQGTNWVKSGTIKEEINGRFISQFVRLSNNWKSREDGIIRGEKWSVLKFILRYEGKFIRRRIFHWTLDCVGKKEDNVRTFESDVRDCKLFFYRVLASWKHALPYIPPRQIFLFCCELNTAYNLFHNLEKLLRQREIFNSD